jgi:hypothetical protein
VGQGDPGGQYQARLTRRIQRAASGTADVCSITTAILPLIILGFGRQLSRVFLHVE